MIPKANIVNRKKTTEFITTNRERVGGVIDGIGEDFEARRFYWLKLSC
jgi:hypothetical protein